MRHSFSHLDGVEPGHGPIPVESMVGNVAEMILRRLDSEKIKRLESTMQRQIENLHELGHPDAEEAQKIVTSTAEIGSLRGLVSLHKGLLDLALKRRKKVEKIMAGQMIQEPVPLIFVEKTEKTTEQPEPIAA